MRGSFQQSRGTNFSASHSRFNANRYKETFTITNMEPSPKIGGRLRFFLEQWKHVSSDSWILSVIEWGLELNFHSPPVQGAGTHTYEFG